ncbi:DUF305 domain-containing protein [Actinoallomurus acanthiterrae]
MRRALSSLVAMVAAAVLAACGGGAANTDQTMTGHAAEGHAVAVNSISVTAGHNAQDVMFAQMMIPHHQQAIVMADQAATRASSPQVKTLAAQIKQAQGPEIRKMTGWLRDWGAPMPSPGGMHMAEGMMSEQDMKRLGTLSGRPFDRMFLQMMIRHHQGAVTMARAEESQGSNPDAKALAASIISSQSAEIAKMRHMLTGM